MDCLMFCIVFTAQMREAYLKLYPGGSNKTTFSQFARIPNLQAISKTLYSVPDPTGDVNEQPIWWSNGDTANANANTSTSETGFLGLPYLPFFSNCKGSDSYISLSKVLETGLSKPLNAFRKLDIDTKICCFPL